MSDAQKVYNSLTSIYGPLTEKQFEIADKFYDRIKDKQPAVLQRYESIVRPQGMLDMLCNYMLNDDRKARHAAVNRVLSENKIVLLSQKR
ncbi:MAG: hypothetical protein V1729_02885 [Candidatus Woesearchaeota archaeon]